MAKHVKTDLLVIGAGSGGLSVAAGASQLVIGRPITQSEDPTGAFAQCCAGLTT